MPKKKAAAKSKKRGKVAKKAAKKSVKTKLEDLPAEADLSDEDLDKVRGATGFSVFGTKWSGISGVKNLTQEPAKYPVCPDGIIKNP